MQTSASTKWEEVAIPQQLALVLDMPLQKSFSDQDHCSRRQPQWQRNRSYQGLQLQNALKEQPPEVQTYPVPISSITKSKLNVFQFGAQLKRVAANIPMERYAEESVQSEEKENFGTLIKEQSSSGDSSLYTPNGPKQSSQQNESAKPRKEPPTTPASRLALPDLIGMVDAKSEEQKISPDDRILWLHDGKELHRSDSSYNALRRPRKRARSSSPTSSPASAHFLTKGEAFDLHRLNESLKTPQTDPSSDLWDQFGLSTNKRTPQGPQLPAFAHIMYASSPQSSKEAAPRSEGSLRKALIRSSTCGTEWPNPKRRKVGLTEQREGDDVFSESSNTSGSKLSRLSVLLERVQEGYTTENCKLSPVTSTSPPIALGKVSVKVEESSSLRLENTGADWRHMLQNIPDEPSLQVEGAQCQTETNSSDYGDFDDDAFYDTMVDVANVKAASKLAISTTEALKHTSTRVQQTLKAEFLQKVDEDEFGNIEEEVCVADLVDIVAKYDVNIPGNGIVKGLPVERMLGDCSNSVMKQAATANSDDEYGNDFDDIDFNAAEVAATQSVQQSASSLPPQPVCETRAIQRYLVTNILETQYEASNGRLCMEKILLVQIDQTRIIKTIHLRNSWFETPVSEKAFVHVIGKFEDNGRCIIDDTHNMLILHPDHLISSTVVADSFTCIRRAVLQDRVKASSDASAPLVYGTILHEIFQTAMMANRWDSRWLTEIIENVTTQHLEDLYTIKLQIPQAVEYLQSKMGELQAWAKVFVSSQPKPEAVVKTANGGLATMCVNKLLDVEEHVWSPMYGLKGNIDATVQVSMNDGKTHRTLTVPFEVKTGKNVNASHRAQTALYNLLLSDRYDLDIAYGILYYMETSETIRIPAIRHELRQMIMQRNELACFVRERHAQLPPMLQKHNMCNRCYAKVPCFVYHKLADGGDGETSGMKEKFDEVVKHLTPKHKEFFLKWDDLLTKEEKESLRFRRELWTMLSSEREKLGRCFSNVIIEEGSAYEEQNNPKINRFRYTLIKQTPLVGFSFLDSQIIVGEPIVISDEMGHFALANGYVTSVRKQRITVAVDRRLHNARIRRPGFDGLDNQVFASIMEVAEEGSTAEQAEGKIVEPPVRYRLDKDEFSNGMATVRNNLIQVMAEGPFASQEIRSLVVDLVAPRFKLKSTAYTLTDRTSINVDQQKAIDKVMSAQDYALVLGMPGTGKTTTIAHIIRALVSQGKSVLLTSYTHTAVDNILLKLKYDKIPILRLGVITKVHPDVQEFVTLAAQAKKTFEELRSSWHDSPVVGTTCLGINHPIFNERTFDYCIVDEASQITLPVCLGPVRMAQTFILVGDHNQLPPLVQNEEARTGGLDISLFKLLSDAHPESVVNLEHQYRMCEEVMAPSNNLIYNGRLKCGTPEVAKRSILIPKIEALHHHHYSPSNICRSQSTICPAPSHGQCWIRDMVDPSTKVAFINTDTLLPVSREEAKGNRIVNPTEAKICVQLVESLLSVGVPATSIGVMTHYRSQLALLKHGLRNRNDVEMHTADRFQGRDKEVIILSLVRSNEAKNIGELLKDWRRINVAFTRAKTKLLVVGSRETLKGIASEEMVAKFVGLMEEKGWVYDLPKGALEMHLFDDVATQVMASGVNTLGSTQRKPLDDKIKKSLRSLGKENLRSAPKRAQVGERTLLSGNRNRVLQDIHQDIVG